MNTTEIPIIGFDSQHDFEHWLDSHHGDEAGIWLKIAKKNAGVPSVTYAEAVESALCYGWIDGQLKSFDDKFYLQKFTPRRSKSVWSKINREKVAVLQAAGRMRPTGLAAVEAAKANGQWDLAYDSAKDMQVSDDFAAALAQNKKAQANFDTLDRTNRYAVLWRIQTSRTPEKRAQKIAQLVAMLAAGEKIHNTKT